MFGSKLPDSYRLSIDLEKKCAYCKDYVTGMCNKFKTLVLPEYTFDDWELLDVK